jgi:hypothetical protein
MQNAPGLVQGLLDLSVGTAEGRLQCVAAVCELSPRDDSSSRLFLPLHVESAVEKIEFVANMLSTSKFQHLVSYKALCIL